MYSQQLSPFHENLEMGMYFEHFSPFHENLEMGMCLEHLGLFQEYLETVVTHNRFKVLLEKTLVFNPVKGFLKMGA